MVERLPGFYLQNFKTAQIKNMAHFAEMYYTVKVSDTRDDDSSNTVQTK